MSGKRHMGRVAQMQCRIGLLLGEDHGPVEVHHIREGQGMGQRASDYLTIPLCPECHRGQHGIHGDRTIMRIVRVTELDLLADTIRELMDD